MKITFISEDHPNGIEADWPVVPHAGETIAFRYGGGTVIYHVDGVKYEADGAGNLEGAVVHLTL